MNENQYDEDYFACPEDECEECINNIKKGDELFDQLEVAHEELENLHHLYHIKCDEYQNAMLLIGDLRTILAENKISHEL